MRKDVDMIFVTNSVLNLPCYWLRIVTIVENWLAYEINLGWEHMGN